VARIVYTRSDDGVSSHRKKCRISRLSYFRSAYFDTRYVKFKNCNFSNNIDVEIFIAHAINITGTGYAEQSKHESKGVVN